MRSAPRASPIRYQIEPRDIAPAKAARRLGLTEVRFAEVCHGLYARGFPRPDPDTGHYDLKAIDAWMDRRSGLTPEDASRHASVRLRARIDAWDGGAAAS